MSPKPEALNRILCGCWGGSEPAPSSRGLACSQVAQAANLELLPLARPSVLPPCDWVASPEEWASDEEWEGIRFWRWEQEASRLLVWAAFLWELQGSSPARPQPSEQSCQEDKASRGQAADSGSRVNVFLWNKGSIRPGEGCSGGEEVIRELFWVSPRCAGVEGSMEPWTEGHGELLLSPLPERT